MRRVLHINDSLQLTLALSNLSLQRRPPLLDVEEVVLEVSNAKEMLNVMGIAPSVVDVVLNVE